MSGMTAEGRCVNGSYEFKSFRAGRTVCGADAATSAWLEATALSFHIPPPSAEHMARVAASYQEYDRVLTGVYTSKRLAGAWDATRPVATYATFVKPMNVGHGRFLDTHLIADVTVRTTHRRRGLMRALISADLRRAAEDGIAIAALRAMEATIYPQFGFGVAVIERDIEVDTSEAFALQHVPAGCVEVAEPSALLDVAPAVFSRFHARTVGSIGRPGFYPKKIAGIWAEDRPLPDRSVRAALHYDPAGQIDGYVSYKFVERQSQPWAIEVVDLVGTSSDAYLGLWDYLAAIDLATMVRYRQAPATDILAWAMVDRGGLRVVGEEDALWLRILDPIAALQGRRYDVDGEVRIAVSDPLDIGTGIYDLLVRDGVAMVTRANAHNERIDVSMNVSALSSVYLGGVRARVLAQAGRIVASTTAALDHFDALMASMETPYCTTQF